MNVVFINGRKDHFHFLLQYITESEVKGLSQYFYFNQNIYIFSNQVTIILLHTHAHTQVVAYSENLSCASTSSLQLELCYNTKKGEMKRVASDASDSSASAMSVCNCCQAVERLIQSGSQRHNDVLLDCH